MSAFPNNVIKLKYDIWDGLDIDGLTLPKWLVSQKMAAKRAMFCGSHWPFKIVYFDFLLYRWAISYLCHIYSIKIILFKHYSVRL